MAAALPPDVHTQSILSRYAELRSGSGAVARVVTQHISLISRKVRLAGTPSVARRWEGTYVLSGKVNSMSKVPSLSISPEKVFFIVSKTHQSEMEASAPELIADLEDDDAGEGQVGKNTDLTELSGFISDLNVDEQIDLVALMWLGRGDGDLDSFPDLRSQAADAHNNRTGAYLLGTPMFADYLEEAMSAFGLSGEDFEEDV